MKTVNLTDAEYYLLQRALITFNDMESDMAFEKFETNLFPSEAEPTVLTQAGASKLRKEINDLINEEHLRHTLLGKVGFQIDKNGYVDQ